MKRYFKKNKETIENFFWRALQIFGKQGFSFLIFFICAQLLNSFDFGIYNYILAIVYLLVIFSDFGISLATSKEIAERKALGEKDNLKKVAFNSFILILGLSILVAAVAIILFNFIFTDKTNYLTYILPLVFLIPISALYDGIYRGLKKFKELSAITTINGLFSLFFVYFFVDNYGLTGALVSQLLFYVFLSISLSVALKLNFFLKQVDLTIIKKIFYYSLLVGLSNVGYFLYTRVDVLFLGFFNLVEEISYYEIINKIFMIVLLPITILGTVVAPNTAKNSILQRYDYLFKKIKTESFLLLIVGLITSILFFFLLPIIFENFFPSYDLNILEKMLLPILLLIPFRFFSSYVTVGYITPSGNVKITTILLLVFGIFNAFLDFIFIAKWGLMGVIFATILSQLPYIIIKDTLFFFKLRKLSLAERNNENTK